jgi:hypothetical protein
MYTKTGLSALAIAGITFGVVGMLTGASNASTAPDCRAPSAGVAVPAASGGNPASSDSNAKPADKKKAANGVDKVTNRAKRRTASGTNGPNGSNLVDVKAPNDGGAHATVPGDGTAPSVGTSPSGTSSDQPFLDLQGNTQSVDTTSGTASVPPSGAHVVGRSSQLGSLIHVTGRANSGR